MALPFHLYSSVPADYVYHIFFILLFALFFFFFWWWGAGERNSFLQCSSEILVTNVTNGLPWWLSSKESTCNAEAAEDAGSIPGSGTSLGGGYDNPLQYSCPENPMDRGTWWATIYRAAKSQARLK